jgi:tRNA threonylcarbamoyladenosine biosynthesis protein TsaB
VRTEGEKHIKVLAIDTAGETGSVALIENEQLLGEYIFSGARTYSEKLLSMIDRLLADHGCPVQNINLVAVSSGPGSFTGLRVGISTAQGIALAEGKNLMAVPTLEVIAYQACGHREQICPMIDVRGQEIYTALFQLEGSGELKRITDETVTKTENWLASIKEKTVFLGNGACRYAHQITSILGVAAIVLPPYAGISKASTVARLARQRYLHHARNDLYNIAPVYVRPPDAERSADSGKESYQPVIIHQRKGQEQEVRRKQ